MEIWPEMEDQINTMLSLLKNMFHKDGWLSVQEWHRELVNARLASLEGREEDIGLTREQVWEQVDPRRGS